ncbi:MAG: nucleotide exchange factor GrpE [Anaerolineae bacterium]|nr:nucleotide exchange factor GrpE [Anaerolineae bacterium]
MHTKPEDLQNKPSNGEAEGNGKATGAPNSNGTSIPVTGTVEDQLKEAQSKAAEYLDGWQRARADFANYRKRADKERDEAYQNAAAETLAKLLPILDDLDLAINNVPAERANDDVVKGFQMIYRKLGLLLEGAGIKVINPVGEPFNPTQHEALGEVPAGDVAAGHVASVLRKGYLYGDRVLRAALVRVAS